MALFKLSANEEERSQELHQSSIVVDTQSLGPVLFSKMMQDQLGPMIRDHVKMSRLLGESTKLEAKELISNPEYRLEFRALINKSGVTALSRTSGAFFGDQAWTFESAIAELGLWCYKFDVLKDLLIKINKAEDIRRSKKEGKLGVLLNLQNASHIGDNLENLETFFNLGIRIIQLTYNTANLVADGCVEPNDGGLTLFGYDVVERMNKLGILVDLSHCSRQTALDAAESSKRPVAYTHVACKSLTEQSRTKTDEEMQAVAEKGGYIGITAVPAFVTANDSAKLENYLDHLQYAIKLVGAKNVGIASDWPASNYPISLRNEINRQASAALNYRWRKGERPVDWTADIESLENYTKLPNITRGLVARGYSDNEIKNVLGGNFLRIFQRVVG